MASTCGYFSFMLFLCIGACSFPLIGDQVSKDHLVDTKDSLQNVSPTPTPKPINPYIQQETTQGFWGNRNNLDSRDYYQRKNYGDTYYNQGGWPFYEHGDYQKTYPGYNSGGNNPNYYYQYDNTPYYYNQGSKGSSFPYGR